MAGKKVERMKRVREYLVITVAVFFYSAGISLFLDANNLASGGVTGIAIILNRLLFVETGTLILILNVPLLILGAYKFGARFIFSTGYCIVLVSVVTNVFSGLPPMTDDILIAAVAGEVLIAGSMGVIFKNHATTGGMDIVVKILRRRYPHLKTGSIFLMIDVCIVALSGVLFRNFEAAMYAGIGIFVNMMILDLVLYGKDEAKLIYIISEKYEGIAVAIMEEIESGVTFLEGKGAYSGREKKIVFCVVRKQRSAKVEEIVKSVDENAFMIVSSASEIFGEGYKSITAERL